MVSSSIVEVLYIRIVDGSDTLSQRIHGSLLPISKMPLSPQCVSYKILSQTTVDGLCTPSPPPPRFYNIRFVDPYLF